MKIHFLPTAAGLLLIMLSLASAQFTPVIVPPEPVPLDPSTGPLSDASELSEVFGDAAGNTLYVIEYTKSDGAGVVDQPYDLWIMVSGKGRVLATKFFFNNGSGTIIDVISFSRQRILAQVDEGNGVFVRAFRPENGDFVSEGRVLSESIEGAGEVNLITRSVPRLPRKFFDAVIKSGSKVSQIRRFDLTKLRPEPQQ